MHCPLTWCVDSWHIKATYSLVLIHEFIHNHELDQAVKLLDKILKLGFQPDIFTHSRAIVKGLCRTGNRVGALKCSVAFASLMFSLYDSHR